MFRPYTKEDKLEVGLPIELADRQGVIEDIHASHAITVKWSDGNKDVFYTFERFPGLKIMKPAKPLTIDKRVKGEILCMMSDQGTALDKFITIEDYLNSLEET